MIIGSGLSTLSGGSQAEGFDLLTESGDSLTTEGGDHIVTEDAP